MKLNLLILFFAAAITAAQGYRSRILHDLENIYEDEALEALEGTRDEALHKRLIDPLVQEDPDSGNNTCDCGAVCDKLHVTRLPHNVRVSLTRMNSVYFVCFLHALNERIRVN